MGETENLILVLINKSRCIGQVRDRYALSFSLIKKSESFSGIYFATFLIIYFFSFNPSNV